MNKSYYIIGALVLVIYFMFGKIQDSSRALESFKSQVEKLEFSNQAYVEERDELGRQIVEQEQLILSQKDAIRLGQLEIDRLKYVSSQVQINTITQIDSVFVPFVSDSTSVFQTSNEWYSIAGEVSNYGVNFDSLAFVNKMNVTIGLKSNGWFKKPTPSVLLVNENPYSSTIYMQNVVIKEEKKWWQKNSTIFGIGVLSGIILDSAVR